jgi:hypothetical protein
MSSKKSYELGMAAMNGSPRAPKVTVEVLGRGQASHEEVFEALKCNGERVSVPWELPPNGLELRKALPDDILDAHRAFLSALTEMAVNVELGNYTLSEIQKHLEEAVLAADEIAKALKTLVGP